MSFPCGSKVCVHANVQAYFSGLEPDSPSGGEVGRLRMFLKAENAHVKGSCGILLTTRHSELHVIQTINLAHKLNLKDR